MDVTICPFCLTMFLYSQHVGAECPSCEIGIIENFEEYTARTAEMRDQDERDTRDTKDDTAASA